MRIPTQVASIELMKYIHRVGDGDMPLSTVPTHQSTNQKEPQVRLERTQTFEKKDRKHPFSIFQITSLLLKGLHFRPTPQPSPPQTSPPSHRQEGHIFQGIHFKRKEAANLLSEMSLHLLDLFERLVFILLFTGCLFPLFTGPLFTG